MSDCTVLLTCVGGLISPSQIDSLKNNPDNRKVKIIGTDMNEYAIGQYLTDKFYKVPAGDDHVYVDTILDICEKEKIDVVFPASHEEALTLSKNRKLFEDIGTVIAVSKYEILELAFDKAKTYSFLKKHSLLCPNFYKVKSIDEFINAAEKLGFPQKDIVMKPSLARGGRGARILTNKSVVEYLLYEKAGSLYANFYDIVKTLEDIDEQNFPELIVMEYLPGNYYSVDFLARNGDALIIVPKTRIIGTPSQTLVGQVKKDAFIEENIRKISKAFRFDYNINIEMKCSENGIPLPYDLNPRVAASVAFCAAAGANLIYYALKIALDEKIPENVNIKDGVRMMRYFKELYV